MFAHDDDQNVEPATNPGPIDLAALGIDQEQAADLRHRLSTFIDDWDRPDMDIYDNY